MKSLTLNESRLLREYIRDAIFESMLLGEGVPVLKAPEPGQEKAFIDLVKWVADKLKAPVQYLKKALMGAQSGDWSDALELVRDFYVMKGIKFQAA
jgi:hypothetical protein